MDDLDRNRGTSLSNVLSSTNAKLATISFQPRSAPLGPSSAATDPVWEPSMSSRLAEAPVFVPRSASTLPDEPSVLSPPPAALSSAEFDAPIARDEERTQAVRHPLQYHLYAPPFPHVSNFHPAHLAAMTFFMDPALQETLQRKQEALHAAAVPPELGGPEKLPDALHVYHSLVPLEPGDGMLPPGLSNPRFAGPSTTHGLTGASGDPSRVFGYRTATYKATCVLDGKCYLLRRLEGFQLQHDAAIATVERWRKIRHPSIVAVREAFTTRAFGDASIVFVYDYHPLATTLYMEHMTVKPLQPDQRTGRLQPVSMHVPERVVWSYACQLGALLRVVHGAGLAARSIEPSKVLRTAQHRIRLAGCAIFDVVLYQPKPPPDTLLQYQREDFVALGKLLLCVACNSVAAAHTPDASFETLSKRKYSSALETMLARLMQTNAHEPFTADTLIQFLAPYMADEFAGALNLGDLLEASLMRELENGRLVRLLCKLNVLGERHEYEQDAAWSETGDRYVLMLFHDMVFHTVDENGRATPDLSHILTQLNKLDAGIDERIMLTSRDELTCLVVTYAEVKRCMEAAYRALTDA
ncbi:Pan3p [Malassezia vespertilionis]|uniref:PAN2-PAN3 deadenylation complex subunit PAN3 n=2 Tax=Malassezia vespertilionis TaxID=2020962 RepID=A0A2N1J9H9_9BASI|nr:Pan3p [Malassezia vespertilionis]